MDNINVMNKLIYAGADIGSYYIGILVWNSNRNIT